jgi:uncharacterized membrane protein
VIVGDVLVVAMRWVHALAAIVWLGGGAYMTFVLGPQLRALDDREVAARLRAGLGREFGRWVNAAIGVFIVSGVVLTFERLSGPGATVAYGVVLAVKVGLAFWMFAIAQRLNRLRPRSRPDGRLAALRWQLGSPRLLLWLGAIVVLLAAVLKVLYDAALGG